MTEIARHSPGRSARSELVTRAWQSLTIVVTLVVVLSMTAAAAPTLGTGARYATAGPTLEDAALETTQVANNTTAARTDSVEDTTSSVTDTVTPATEEAVDTGTDLVDTPTFATGSPTTTAAATDDTTLVVDDDGEDCPDASYQEIQAAVNASDENDTVRVCSGTYTESVTIDDKTGLSLIADGDVLLDGETTRDVGIHVDRGRAIRIEGFEIRDFRTGIRVDGTLEDSDGTTGFFDSNQPPVEPVIAENTIAAPGLELDGFGIVDLGAAGILIRNTANATVSRNTIREVNSGMYLESVRDSRVASNRIAVRTDIDTTSRYGVSRGIMALVRYGTPPSGGPENPLHDLEDAECEPAPGVSAAGPDVHRPGSGQAGTRPTVDDEVLAAGGTEECVDEVTNALNGEEWATNNTFVDNVISRSGNENYAGPGGGYNNDGFVLTFESGDRLVNNTVVDSHGNGFKIFGSHSVEMVDNRVENTHIGVSLFTNYAILRGNTIEDSEYGASIIGRYHEIDRSNTVDGKPIVYLENVTNHVIDSSSDPAMVVVVNGTNVSVRDVTVGDNSNGVRFVDTTDSSIENVTVRDSWSGIYLFNSDMNGVTDNTVIDEKESRGFGNNGITLRFSDENVVRENAISGPGYMGIRLDATADNLVVDNHVEKAIISGIYTVYSEETVFRDNHVSDVYWLAVQSATSEETTVANNTVTDSGWGLTFYNQGSAHVQGNVLEDNFAGIDLRDTEAATMRDNRMARNTYNFWAGGADDVDTSNTVDGKPIYYLVNETDRTIDGSSNAGYVGIVDSENVTVRDVELANVGQGVVARSSSGVQVENVTVSTAVWGVEFLDGSHGAFVANTTIQDAYRGVTIVDSDGVSAVNTTVTTAVAHPPANVWAEQTGVLAENSDNTTVARNTIVTDARWGIAIEDTAEATIRGNIVRETHTAVHTVDGEGTPGLQIAGNVLADNDYGIHLNDDTGAQDGLLAAMDDSPEGAITIRDNVIADNANAGVLLGSNAAADEIDLHENTIAGNGAYGVDARRVSNTVNATDNYWGDASGPSSPDPDDPLEDPETGALATGTGDTVSEGDEAGVSNVRFDPFSSEPPHPLPGVPVVDHLDLSAVDRGNNPHAMFEAAWNISDSDGDLETVELTLRDVDDGEVEDTATIDVSGESAENVTTLKAHQEANSGHTYEVELVVTDAANNTASDVDSEIEDEGSDDPGKGNDSAQGDSTADEEPAPDGRLEDAQWQPTWMTHTLDRVAMVGT